MTTTSNLCAVCSEPGKLCSGCHNIHYCSPAHQREDWHVHGTVCRTFKNFLEPPGPNMTRVILFPINSTKPVFRWLPVKSHPQHINPGTFFGSGCELSPKALTDVVNFKYEPKSGREMDHRLTLQFRDSCKRDGSLPNPAIHALTRNNCHIALSGPFLAFGNTVDKTRCVDLDTKDLRLAVDWFEKGHFACTMHETYLANLRAETNPLDADEAQRRITKHLREKIAKGEEIPEYNSAEWLAMKYTIELEVKMDEMGGATKTDRVRELSADEQAWRDELRATGRLWSQNDVALQEEAMKRDFSQ